jgi:hypothetical protein
VMFEPARAMPEAIRSMKNSVSKRIGKNPLAIFEGDLAMMVSPRFTGNNFRKHKMGFV